MATSIEAGLNAQEALDFIFADEDSDEEGIIDEEEEFESSSENAFEDELDDVNGEPEISGPLPGPRARGGVQTRRGQQRVICTRGGSISAKRKKNENKTAKEAQLELKWSDQDSEPVIPPLTGSPELKVNLPVESKIIDFVCLFLTDQFFEIISEQTNLYAERYIASHPDERCYCCSQLWVPTSRDDIRKFLALYLLAGIIQKPALSQYWSTDPLLQASVFNCVVSRNRFQVIPQFIHFADNTFSYPRDSNRDRLYKVPPIVEYLVDKFKSVYIPSKYISIDEELLLWRGWLIFKQYIPNKRAWSGIKMFSLYEDSRYLWNSFMYVVKNGEPKSEEKELERRIG